MNTTLRIEAVSRSGFDARLAHLGSGRLTRTAGATYLESDGDIDDAIHQLALAGVRSWRSSVPDLVHGLRAATASHLDPLDPMLGAVDVVEIGRISLGEASASLMRRELPWQRPSKVRLDPCRRLLREEDAIIGWRRILWCSIAALRVVRTHVRVRPIVFDRAAIERQELRWTYANDGVIERWAFS